MALNDGKPKRKIRCVLIAGGKYHDIDFARLELLKLLAQDERVRVRVFENYGNTAAIAEADFLVTYTCDVTPPLKAQEALCAFLDRGGRWYALHGTNSILRFLADGRVESPRWAPLFMRTLGSMFIAHPPIAPYTVTVADPTHPLVRGVAPFETTDELYLLETYGPVHTLLETHFAGEATGFVQAQWAAASHPVFYTKQHGKGAILYLTLGHCRGHYDLQPLMDYWPSVDRCAWDLPVFYDLLQRGIAWAIEPLDAPPMANGAPP